MIALQDVTVEVGGRVVLRDLSFTIAPGERVVLLGVNGCGKTSLLKLLDGLAFPAGGEIRYAGERLDRGALDRAEFRRRFRSEVALLFQNVDAMLFNPSVGDEIAFGPRQLGLEDVDARVARWAETFGVSGFLDRAPFELSGGEKKRVALAALVDFLAAVPDITVIASTHNLTVAEELGSRAILLARGGILYDGPTSALLRDEPLLVASGLAHRHVHRHGRAQHAHFHVHAVE